VLLLFFFSGDDGVSNLPRLDPEGVAVCVDLSALFLLPTIFFYLCRFSGARSPFLLALSKPSPSLPCFFTDLMEVSPLCVLIYYFKVLVVLASVPNRRFFVSSVFPWPEEFQLLGTLLQ